MYSLSDKLLNGVISPLSRFVLSCEPVTITMAAMGAAQAGMTIASQYQARDTHNSVEEHRRQQQEVAIEENRRRATHDYITSVRLEQQQAYQEQEAVRQKSMDIERQGDASVATGMASAAERGVAGRTVNQIATDFDFMANEETGRLQENQKIANLQHNENIRAYGSEYSNRVSSLKPYVKTPAAPVDFFGPVFRAGAQTLGTATDMAKIHGSFSNAFGSVATTPKAKTGTMGFHDVL